MFPPSHQDVDITQAQQISKHIVADVIQQARDKLTNDMHGQMKRKCLVITLMK